MYTLKNMPGYQEHQLRYERLVFNFSINGNATPANKTQQVDVPGLINLRMQGQTAAADAVENDFAWLVTPVDNNAGNSAFGILLNLQGNEAEKIYNVTVTQVPSSPPAPVPASLLGSASSYAVLGASAVTNTGNSVLTGNLGIYPNNASSVTGFPPGTVSGQLHEGDAAAAQAQVDALAAYTSLSAHAGYVAVAAELGGQSLGPGYYSTGAGQITGGLTLTLTGSASDIFVIKTASTLITGVGAGGQPVITLAGGALASNVYWLVGSSATINSAASSAGAVFRGNLIANTSVTLTQTGTATNSIIALNGAVTMSAANTMSASQTAQPPVVVVSDAFVTPQGNIAIEVSNAGLSLAAAANTQFLVRIEYLELRDNYAHLGANTI